MMWRAIASAFIIMAASPAALVSTAGARTVTSSVGETLTIEPGEEHTRWVELSGPSILLRRGESDATELSLRPGTRGTYAFASLPREDASLREAELVVLEVLSPASGAGGPTARISGNVAAGAEEDTVLRAHVLSEGDEVQFRTRWKQLGGPRLDLDGEQLREPGILLRPTEPGRYRFAVSLRGRAWRTPWATFTFEVPLRADGSADRRPVARLTAVPRATVGDEVVLDGSRSFDPDGDELTFVWEKVLAPAGDVLGAGRCVRIFPPLPGLYLCTLRVADPYGLQSETESVAIRVDPVPEFPAADPEAADPMDRPFTVRLEEAPLSSLFSRLSDQGVTVRTAPDLGDPAALAAKRIDLWAVELPARRVVDWVGRILDASYVVEGAGNVWFTRRTKWLEREPRTAETYRIDALYAEDDASDLLETVRESVKAVLWAGEGVNVCEPDLQNDALTTILPRSAQRRLSRLLGELRREVPSGPPPPESDAPFARMLSRQVRTGYRDWTLRDIAWDLARQSRVTVAFGYGRAGDWPGGRRLTVDVGTVALAQALETLVREAGFTGFQAEPPGAVWLYEGAPPARTSRCAWQAAEVRSYDVRTLESRHGFSGPMLVHMVRGRALPERWEDPFVMVRYSAARKRLVVIHHAEVQRAVGALFDRLVREGEGALE